MKSWECRIILEIFLEKEFNTFCNYMKIVVSTLLPTKSKSKMSYKNVVTPEEYLP